MNAPVGNVVSKPVATESYRTSGKAKGLVPLAVTPHEPPHSIHTPCPRRRAHDGAGHADTGHADTDEGNIDHMPCEICLARRIAVK